MKIVSLIALMMCMFSTCSRGGDPCNKKVYLTVVARDSKAHLLPKFFKCIDNLNYNKKLIDVQIICGNNFDNSFEIIQDWQNNHKKKYHQIQIDLLSSSNPEGEPFSIDRKFKQMRNESLKQAKESNCEYYFVLDANNFVAPWTLKTLIEKDKPIIAPLLLAIPEFYDVYSNFFGDVAENGYYQDHPNYWLILNQVKVGTFEVPLVHCAYLIQKEYLDQLTYQDETGDYEFIVFARSARNHHIDQYICNETDFGVLVHFHQELSLKEQQDRLEAILTMPSL
ncbi:MAG: hypothetical protein K1000chlam2_01039 [Chlamydiae bacterium]|nr:hypothetical protein [Chlamydiota bacterium]